MREHDSTGDGALGFDEFKVIFKRKSTGYDGINTPQ